MELQDPVLQKCMLLGIFMMRESMPLTRLHYSPVDSWSTPIWFNDQSGTHESTLGPLANQANPWEGELLPLLLKNSLFTSELYGKNELSLTFADGTCS